MTILFKPYPIIKKILFCMNEEKAHKATLLAVKAASKFFLTRIMMQSNIIEKTTKIMGLKLHNPVGLAAGMDKNGEYIDALGLLGFGFIEVGTVTPLSQKGNSIPRLFRIPKDHAIVNRMGFNNCGIVKFIRNIRMNKWQKNGGILGINIGKNANTSIANAIDDYISCMNDIYEFADYITINISSPNTKDLRSLQDENTLNVFLSQIYNHRLLLSDKYGHRVPIAIKIAPDLKDDHIAKICDLFLKYGIDGIIATNTTNQLNLSINLPKNLTEGGLSGKPLNNLSTAIIAKVKKFVGDDISIIGSGGILSKEDALEKIHAGANAIQLYTGLIYNGPNLINECIKTF